METTVILAKTQGDLQKAQQMIIDIKIIARNIEPEVLQQLAKIIQKPEANQKIHLPVLLSIQQGH